MGVDIPDIRLILHDHLPTNMIDYVQQSGRAGRDGETAYALLLFSPAGFAPAFTRAARQIRVQHKHRPFTQYALIQREWRPYRRVLRFCLQAPCLSQGISAAFGQKSAPLRELLGVPERRNRQGNPEYPADDGAGTVLLDFAAASG